MRRSLFHTAALAVALLAVAAPAAAQEAAGGAPSAPARDWKRTLRVKIDSAFQQSEASLTLQRITRPGDVLVLQKDGMAVKPGIDGLNTTSTYEDDAIVGPRGLFAAISDNNAMQTLRKGAEFYTIGTGVADDKIVLRLVGKDLSTITVAGNTRQVRLAGQLAIAFPRGYLATAPFEDVVKQVNEVIRTQADAAAPRTVALGQTRAEVESALGTPTSVVDLGAKMILIYPTMKVILQDGKVADVQ